MSKTTNKFSPEVRERAVRLVLDSEAARAIGSSGSPNGQHGSRWQAVLSISSKIGCAPQTLNDWVNKAEVDSGKRAGVSSEMGEKMKALERENRELRRAIGGRFSTWQRTRCFTASKPIAPSCSAFFTAACRSSRPKLSSRRSTCTYSRRPALIIRASIRRRRVANSGGRFHSAKGAA